MSDAIKHECGIVLVRLLKPLEFYKEKYGSIFYGFNKLYLLMEKQHNRGQDGAGIASVKFDVDPGYRYISRERSNTSTPIKDIFKKVNLELAETYKTNPEEIKDPKWMKNNVRFAAELFLGHLRYGTFGKNSIDACHPFIRENNWMSRNLVIAGNFNLTNVDQLFDNLIGIGQHPKEYSDTVTIMEKIGHFLDEENNNMVRQYKQEGLSKPDISRNIAKNIDIGSILNNACKKWDGGYAICGLIGHGDAFVIRDAAGIRPAFYYIDDEVAVVASERPAIQTAFNVPSDQVKELPPANALIIKKDGRTYLHQYREPITKRSCSFERIYFSRGTDTDIYKERKELGRHLAPIVREAINHDFANTVFSYIPNTAETCFFGLCEAMKDHCRYWQKEQIMAMGPNIDPVKLEELLAVRPRIEKLAVKDVKMRTFITEDSARNELAAHVYDITYGVVNRGSDTLVVVDDSIVRGTTLRESIFKILDRTGPLKIIFVSSAPQIRYPDCYGIDMAKLGDFIAFRAAVELLKDTGREAVLQQVYEDAQHQLTLPLEEMQNAVKSIYRPFSAQQVSDKIAELLRPEGMKAEVKIIYQTIENLHLSCPEHTGDWYFTGDYPTLGGTKVVNRSYINYFEGKGNQRSY